jgi:MFS family permease
MPPASMVRALGRALRHRNYRLFFAGQSVSLVGTWLTRVATSWLVYRLTGSTWLLGVVGFAGQIPTFVFAPLAGVWVDRLNRHRVLVATQALAMLQSALLALFALRGSIGVAHVIWLSVFQGLINAVDMPARQAFLVEMIEDRRDLSNAIALNSSMVNAARFLGPSVAGILIAAVGEGWCFLIDAISYLGVIASLLAMRVPRKTGPRRTGRVLTELAEGVRYAATFSPIRTVLLLVALVSLMGVPYTVLMPALVTTQLAGGAHALGFLMAAAGLGALGGALYLASRTSVVGLGKIIALAATSFGVSLILFSQSRSLWLSLLLIFPTGMAMMTQMAASNTVLQSIVDDDKRGRVMSLFGMAFFGTVPFGSLLGGGLSARIGVSSTIAVGGAACVVGGLLFYRALPMIRKAVRPIYVQRGILPDD